MNSFKQSNQELQTASPSLQSLTTTVIQQTSALTSMGAALQELTVHIKKKDAVYSAQNDQLSALTNEVHVLKTELAKVKTQLVMARQTAQSINQQLLSPDRNVRPQLETTTDASTNLQQSMSTLNSAMQTLGAFNQTHATAASAPNNTPIQVFNQHETPAPAQTQVSVPAVDENVARVRDMVPNSMRTPAPLFWSARAAQNSTGDKTGKGLTVSALLTMLYHDGVLRGVDQFRNASIPSRFSTPSAAKSVLLLSQLCMDTSEAEKIRNGTFSDELEMHQVANDIELRVFKLM